MYEYALLSKNHRKRRKIGENKKKNKERKKVGSSSQKPKVHFLAPNKKDHILYQLSGMDKLCVVHSST
jgi:hypothetical protein